MVIQQVVNLPHCAQSPFIYLVYVHILRYLDVLVKHLFNEFYYFIVIMNLAYKNQKILQKL